MLNTIIGSVSALIGLVTLAYVVRTYKQNRHAREWQDSMSIRKTDSIIRGDPNIQQDIKEAWWRARKHYEQKEYKEAEGAYRYAFECETPHRDIQHAQMCLEFSRLLYKMKEYKGATKYAKKILEIDTKAYKREARTLIRKSKKKL